MGGGVPEEHSEGDADGHLGDPALPLAVGHAERDHSGDRREERQVVAEDVGGEKVVVKKLSKQDIAKMIGASREMVSRVMKVLEERGFIQTQENGSIVVKERLNALG